MGKVKTKTEKKPTPKKKPDSITVLKEGAMIRLKDGSHMFGTTRCFEPRVYELVYKVIEIRGNRVVFGTIDNRLVIGSVTKADCIVQ